MMTDCAKVTPANVTLEPFSVVASGTATTRFYLGDCCEVLSRLDPGSVDVIMTSPPYNIGADYGTYQDTLSPADYLAWTEKWIAAAARLLRPAGSLFLNVGSKPSDRWTPFDVAQLARRHLQLQNTIIWVKSITIDRASVGASAGLANDLSVGHFKPINSARFLNDCHEFIFHLSPSGSTALDRLALGVPYQDPSNIGRFRAAKDGIRCRGNVWFIPYETIQRRERDRPHPATFPEKLPELCIRLHGTSRTKLVVDPFVGLGSTAVAAAKLGVDCVGIDIDEQYLNGAVERVRDVMATPTLWDQ